MPLVLKTDAKKKSKKFELEKINIIKDDKDIYLSRDSIRNARYVKDEDIIDQPLLLDMNVFKIDQKKGSLENRLIELEYFTKKKLDELVREIKIYIPIHFNSYIIITNSYFMFFLDFYIFYFYSLWFINF